MANSYYWIKVEHSMLDDPAVAMLPPRLWRRFIEAYLLAGEEHDAGWLPADMEQTAWRLRVTVEQLREDFAALEQRGLMRFDAGRAQWYADGFAEMQAPSNAAQRMRRYRERKRQETDQDQEITDQDQEVDNTVIPLRNGLRNGSYETVTNRNGHTPNGKGGIPLDEAGAHGAVIKAFLDMAPGTRLPAQSEIEAWGGKWIDPVTQVLQWAGDDAGRAIALLRDTLGEMDAQGLSYSCPGSTINPMRTYLRRVKQREAPEQNGAGNATTAAYRQMMERINATG